MNGDVSTRALSDRVKVRASELGFEATGIARATPLIRDHERYEDFVRRGFHGDMDWLARDPAVRRRVDSDSILQNARSVICVASAYRGASDAEGVGPHIARYARGRDYHNGLRKKLRKLAEFVRTLADGAEARPLCDDAPILERAWASRAGLGFIGKNGLLIIPGRGSFVLLGEVVTTVELAHDEPIAERCGTCTRCIDVCPTRAIVEPFVIDARKCISYLTIELRKEMPVELREGVGEHLFGCDDCQTVCPFNASPRIPPVAERYEPLERWARTSLEDLLAIEPDSAAWKAVSEGSPIHRATAEGIARNAAVVLGNRKELAALAALERAAREHPSAIVRDAARWAADRVRPP